jgi:Acyl-CoA thioesterase C-terminal domain/Acyl-CoA thioesterase N-terminal domain
MHGGPVCGALARAIEECESPVPMRVARMTVEMTRAVPLVPLSVRAEVTRAGRRVQQIDARIEMGGRVLARATALRLRIGEVGSETAIPLPDPVPERAPDPAPDPQAQAFTPGLLAGFLRAVDFQRARVPRHGKSGLAWTRLRVPLVEGEIATPFVRLATLCDFASGAGNALDFRRSTSINPDLSLHVLREPRGEWIGLEARTGVEADGIGQSHAVLFDERGAIAHALASLLVERRPGLP